MTGNDSRNRPVGEDEFEKMRDRISQHFDHVRELLERELDDSED